MLYRPSFNKISDTRALKFISSYSFGLIISVSSASEISITSVPFVVDIENRKLSCHFARANPHWKELKTSDQVKIVFNGPHGYVSSSVYQELAPSTWNYTTVHIQGKPTMIEDSSKVINHLKMLSDDSEDTYTRDNSVLFSDHDPEVVNRKIRQIVFFEIDIKSIEGKFKISQNKSTEDVEAVIEYLSNGTLAQQELAEFMSKEFSSINP